MCRYLYLHLVSISAYVCMCVCVCRVLADVKPYLCSVRSEVINTNKHGGRGRWPPFFHMKRREGETKCEKKQPTLRAEKHIEERSKVGACQKSEKTGRKKKREESSRRRDTYQKEKKEKTLDEEEDTWSGLEPLNNNNINFMLEGRSTAASPQSIKKRNSISSILNAHIYWLQSSPWHRLWFFFLLPDGQKLFSSQYCLLEGEQRLLILICSHKHASGSLDSRVKMVDCPPRTWINDAANFSWSSWSSWFFCPTTFNPAEFDVGSGCDQRRRRSRFHLKEFGFGGASD